eukprot:10043784-Alexandrium_andersonii.AAC.1
MPVALRRPACRRRGASTTAGTSATRSRCTGRTVGHSTARATFSSRPPRAPFGRPSWRAGPRRLSDRARRPWRCAAAQLLAQPPPSRGPGR